MATPTRNTATPADESLLDTMAADHVSHMSRRVQQLASHGDAKDRRRPVAPPAPPEPRNEAPDVVAGAFESDTETRTNPSTPIIVDLPLHVSAVDATFESAETEDAAYQPVLTVHPTVKPPPPPEPETNLAEEILFQQMAEEMELETPAAPETEPFEKEEKQDEAVDPVLSVEALLEEEEEDDEELIEVIARQAAAPAPVRPRPTISAIRPPTQPSRIRNLLLQGFIVLLSLTAVGMVAYILGILKL